MVGIPGEQGGQNNNLPTIPKIRIEPDSPDMDHQEIKLIDNVVCITSQSQESEPEPKPKAEPEPKPENQENRMSVNSCSSSGSSNIDSTTAPEVEVKVSKRFLGTWPMSSLHYFNKCPLVK